MTSSFLVLTAGFLFSLTSYILSIFFGRKIAFKYLLGRFFSIITMMLLLFWLITSASLTAEVNDVRLFATAGYSLAHKIDIYWLDPQGGTYSFLPFLIYPYTLFWYLSEKTGLAFSFFVKLLLIPIIYLASLVIAKQLIKQGLPKYQAKIRQLLFLTNPIIFLTIIFHGQADILLIFFYLLSLVVLSSNLKNLVFSGFLMALSVCAKSWSVIFLPLVILKIPKIFKKIIYLMAFCLTIIIFIFVYKLFIFTSFKRIFSVVLNRPTGSSGFWGITAWLNLLGFSEISNFYSHNRSWFLLTGLIFIWFFAWKKKINYWLSSLLIVLLVYCLTAGWGLQHSLWLIPFGLINNEIKKTNLYTFLCLPYLYFSYSAIALNLKLTINLEACLSISVWLFCCWWLWQLLKNFSGRKPRIKS